MPPLVVNSSKKIVSKTVSPPVIKTTTDKFNNNNNNNNNNNEATSSSAATTSSTKDNTCLEDKEPKVLVKLENVPPIQPSRGGPGGTPTPIPADKIKTEQEQLGYSRIKVELNEGKDRHNGK